MSAGVTLSEDGLELTVRVVQPDGRVRQMVVTRAADVGPFDEESIAKVVATASACDRIQPGETRTTRRLTRRLLLHVATGPPTWWLPKLEVTRRSVMVGWLRGLVAVSWRDRPPAPHIR